MIWRSNKSAWWWNMLRACICPDSFLSSRRPCTAPWCQTLSGHTHYPSFVWLHDTSKGMFRGGLMNDISSHLCTHLIWTWLSPCRSLKWLAGPKEIWRQYMHLNFLPSGRSRRTNSACRCLTGEFYIGKIGQSPWLEKMAGIGFGQLGL